MFDLTIIDFHNLNTVIAATDGNFKLALESRLYIPEEWGLLFNNMHQSRWPHYLEALTVPVLEQNVGIEEVEALRLFTRTLGISSILTAARLKPAIFFSRKRMDAMMYLKLIALNSDEVFTLLKNLNEANFASQLHCHIEQIMLFANLYQSLGL